MLTNEPVDESGYTDTWPVLPKHYLNYPDDSEEVTKRIREFIQPLREYF